MSDQQNSAQAGDASSDLSLDYLASAFASNGIIPPMMMRQLQSEAATAVTAGPGQIQNHADLLNAFLMAAAGVTSAGSDALPAPVLLSSMMCDQQKEQQQLSVSASVQPQPQAHSNSSTHDTTAVQYAHHHHHHHHHDLLQAHGLGDLDPSTLNHQQQVALSVASLVAQPSAPHLISSHQRHDYGAHRNESVASSTEESFSAVLAKLTRGLNQGSSSSNTNKTTTTDSVRTTGAAVTDAASSHTNSQQASIPSHRHPNSTASASSGFMDPMIAYQLAAAAGLLDSTAQHYPSSVYSCANQHNTNDLTTAAFAATLAALEQQYAAQLLQHQQKQQHQSQQQYQQKHTRRPYVAEVKHQFNTTVRPTATAAVRETYSHRGRGRPPKSGLTPQKSTVDKVSRATTSTPHSEASSIDSSTVPTSTASNSIDGTITDVLKRLSESLNDQSGGGGGERKKRRVSAVAVEGGASESFPSTSAPSPAAQNAEIPVAKRPRGQTQSMDTGYRLPLTIGWRRETLVKGVGPGGLLGDVVYITPCGRQLWTIESVREYLRSLGSNILTTEDFTFRSSILLGDYYECNKDLKGFVKMSEAAVDALINSESQHPSSAPSNSKRYSQISLPSSSSVTTATATISSSPSSKSSAVPLSQSGPSFVPNILTTPFAPGSVDGYGNFQLGLPRFPSIPAPLTSALAGQIGALWSPWTTAGVQAETTPSTSTSSTSQLQYQTSSQKENPSTEKQQQLQQQGDTSFQEFERLKNFFTKLVDDQREQENKKESERKAKLEVQTAHLKEQRIEQLVGEELRRPTEDMQLISLKPLPPLSRIAGNKMPSQVFADSLLVIEFLHAFTDVLSIEPETIPSFGCLQAAFIDRDETCLAAVNHLIVELLKFAILDPGIPSPRLVTQLIGQRFSEMDVNSETVTGLLRVFLIGRNGYEDEMSDWLLPSNVNQLTDLPGHQLARLLTFICDELVCSSRLISHEVDRTIELQSSLRRDKFNLEAKIRKIHVLLARKFGVDHTEKSASLQPTASVKRPAFLCNSRSSASHLHCESGDEEELNSAAELKERLEVLAGALEAKQHAIEQSAFRLSGVFLGQDRFHRQYFVLGSVGGIYVEGVTNNLHHDHQQGTTSSLCDPDAIVAEIKARREIASARQFNSNSLNSSSCTPNALCNKPSRAATASSTHNEKPSETNKETEDEEPSNRREEEEEDQIPEDPDEMEYTAPEMEDGLKKEEEEEEEQVSFPKFKDQEMDEELEMLSQKNDMKVEGDEYHEEDKVGEVNEEENEENDKEEKPTDVSKECVNEISEKVQKHATADGEAEEEKPTTEIEPPVGSQPLDLSTRRSTPAPTPSTPPPVPIEVSTEPGDLAVWQTLTEHDLAMALEACQMDDTFLTSATLLFTTQMGHIDRSAITGVWADPSWPVILLFYKLQLLRCLAFEMKTERTGDPSCLSSALNHLKKLMAESSGSNGSVQALSVANGIQLDDKELLVDVCRILKERGIQDDSSVLVDIPEDVRSDWWRVDTPDTLESLLSSFSPRGIRERSLAQAIQLSEEAVLSSVSADASSVLDLSSVAESLENGWKPRLLRVRSRRGKGRGANPSAIFSPPSVSSLLSISAVGGCGSGRLSAICPSQSAGNLGDISESLDAYSFRGDFDASTSSSSGVVDKTIFLGENFERAMKLGRPGDPNLSDADREFLDECRFLELIEGLVDRVLSASLQTKGWQPPMKVADDDTVRVVPRASPKTSRYDHWPLNLARERLLDLESHVERRYLLTPLSCESRLDVVTTQTDDCGPEAEAGSDSTATTHEETPSNNGVPHIRRVIRGQHQQQHQPDEDNTSGGPKASRGLVEWRKCTRNADSIAEMKRCAMQFEAAIAWDKSIMKVLCQICRRDKNEARLLLCDGCDHGYHTYCFRPPMVSIPEGDWFCFDCVSKATGKCHCFVCGLAKHIKASGTPDNTPTAFVDPSHRLVKCATCSRGAHMSCLRPPMTRPTRRWNCMLCIVNGASMSAEKVASSDVAASSPATKSTRCQQRERLLTSRPKRPYIKSGAYRGSSVSKRQTLHKSSSTKGALWSSENDAAERRKVGRPKSSANKIAALRKRSHRGRPRAKRPRGGGLEADPSVSDASDKPTEEGSELEDSDAEDNEAEVEGDNEGTKDSGSCGDDGLVAVNGLSSRRKGVVGQATRQSNKPRKPMCFAEREFCRRATEDLIRHELSWPFRKPVCCKSVPFYRKIIKKPMDLTTIMKRVSVDRWNAYSALSEWREDVRLIFKNCQTFNEDDSDIGKAGHYLSKYFESTWTDASRLPVSDRKSPSIEEEPSTAGAMVDNCDSSPRADDSEYRSQHQPAAEDTENAVLITTTNTEGSTISTQTMMEESAETDGPTQSPDNNDNHQQQQQPAESASLIESPVV